jgi:type VI secretion system secreted protein VgrG
MKIEQMTAGLIQASLGFDFLAPPALRGDMKVVSFSGREAISELFSFDILLTSPFLHQESEELEAQMLGRAASLLLHAVAQPPRIFQGVVSAFTLEGAVQSTGEPCVRLRLVPRLWLATQRRQSRIFQDLTVPQIVDLVLNEWQVPRRWSLLEQFAPRAYCTQYQETDYELIARLLAEEGIFFYFDANQKSATAAEAMMSGWTGGNETKAPEQLVLSDHAACYQPLPALDKDAATSSLPDLYLRSRQNSLADDAESVLELALQREIAPQTSMLSGYDFHEPRFEARARASVAGSATNSSPNGRKTGNSNGNGNGGPGMTALVKLDAPELAVQGHEGWALHEAGRHESNRNEASRNRAVVETDDAKKTLAQLRRQAYVAKGRSRNWRLLPGHAFHLAGHPFERVDHDYVVTAVEHHGDVPRTAATTVTEVYHNTFSCVPAEVAYRPAIPERPVVRAAETAIVEASGSEEIHTDVLGRIKVRFYWDLAPGTKGQNSCWIRLAQPWAGAGFGCQFLPRAGSEVVVTFLHGNPDHPLVTGGVYNGSHPFPWVLPGDKSRTGIRTASTPGGWGHNELSFEDAAGAEELLLHAQRNLVEEARGDRIVRIGGNDSTTVAGMQIEAVKLNRVEMVAGNKVSEVLQNRTDTVGGEHRVVVKGPRIETIEQAESRNCDGGQTLRVKGRRNLLVTGALSTQVGLSSHPSEAATTVYGKHTTYCTEGMRFVSQQQIVLECGSSRLIIGPEEVQIETKRLSVKAEESARIEADGPVLAMAKEAEMTAKAIKLYSQGASVELAANADVNGGQVNLNCGAGAAQASNAQTPQAATKLLKLQVHDDDLQVYVNKHYRLVIAGEKYEGTTDGSGYLHETIPKDARVGQLTVWIDKYPAGSQLHWPVALNDDTLPPVTGSEGALLRLRGLGYHSGELAPELTAEARVAVMTFQTDNEIAASGDVDGATEAKLKEIYGV